MPTGIEKSDAAREHWHRASENRTRPLTTANEKVRSRGQTKRGRPRWTASGTPNPLFPPEWSHHRAILSAKTCADTSD